MKFKTNMSQSVLSQMSNEEIDDIAMMVSDRIYDSTVFRAKDLFFIKLFWWNFEFWDEKISLNSTFRQFW